MPTIIVCTNFSETSRNAFAYTCSMVMSQVDKDAFSILLLNVFTIPANYSGDGIALVTINNALDSAEDDLREELEWAHEEFTELNIIGKVTTGRLLDSLKEEIGEMKAMMVVIGAGGHYGELWSWDTNILNALRDLPVPVLTIPPKVKFTPFVDIAFACNLKNIHSNTPFNQVKSIIELTRATLHIVYVASHPIKPGSKEADNQLIVQAKLKDVPTVYHTLYENEVVGAIGRFIEEKKIQLLLVIPVKHGIWESLFRKSYTTELARLNKLPIMALH